HMWPKYPKLAKRSARADHALNANSGRNFGAFANFGPTFAKQISVAPRPAHAEANTTVARQFKPPIPFKKCGEAEPKVNAPTSRATSNPMSFSAQLAAIFIPTGYTPAMHIPTNRRRAGIPHEAGSSVRITMLTTAAAAAAAIKKRRRSKRSASPRSALRSEE